MGSDKKRADNSIDYNTERRSRLHLFFFFLLFSSNETCRKYLMHHLGFRDFTEMNIKLLQPGFITKQLVTLKLLIVWNGNFHG